MIIAVDVYYYPQKAKVVGIIFEKWEDVEPLSVYTEVLEFVEEYIPGEFYKRELPCILSLLKQVDLTGITCIIIDGYVFLGEDKPGLGAHLYHALGQKIPVIGVAKTAFHGDSDKVISIKRGQSQNPLRITAIGIHSETAAESIQKMAGEFRIPTLLKILDQYTKSEKTD